MKRRRLALSLALLVLLVPGTAAAEPHRGLDNLFPGLSADRRAEVFSGDGLILSHPRGDALALTTAPGAGLDLTAGLPGGDAFLVESLMVVPYDGRTYTLLDGYNALGQVRQLKGRLYHSHSRDADIPLFEDATRVQSEKSSAAVADPPPATAIPAGETVYIRLKDVNFGASYYKAVVSPGSRGLTYRLTNYKSLTYLIIPVMKPGNFTAALYLEPLREGMLIYSVAGAQVSDFIASQIDIPSAISKRLAVFIGWIRDGLTG